LFGAAERAADLVVGDPGEQHAQANTRLEGREVSSDAEVDAGAERDVADRPALDIESSDRSHTDSSRFARAGEHDDPLAGLDPPSAEHGVPRGSA
jgi:hypothetical protein